MYDCWELEKQIRKKSTKNKNLSQKRLAKEESEGCTKKPLNCPIWQYLQIGSNSDFQKTEPTSVQKVV